ncbi:cell wall hydrolase [Mediterraneibacter gnavus]|uniref:cell wall hydrolase n=1 Tax=Mediterraneibacter gnavus TaxID=33038 RepID=UPI001186C257|nr:cell wall hydrolase [Mediterraneibacter gnavus]
MKQRKRWMAVLTVWTIALLFAAGFTSQASVSGSKMIQEKNSKYTTGAGAIAAAMESIPAEAVELTKAEAQKAQEAREQAEAEAKRKAEEEAARKAAEEAARKAAEEAARKAAEEAARAQIAAEDQKLLASIIFCEAGNQPYEGQVAVGAVIMNRVRSGVYPNSISEVIYQSGQFGPAMTGWLDTVRSSEGYTQTAMQAAADAMAGVNPIGDCLYFGNGNYGIQIGDHFFH